MPVDEPGDHPDLFDVARRDHVGCRQRAPRGLVLRIVLAMLALLRVAPLLPSPTLRAVTRTLPGRDGKAGPLIELES